ncbi:MAG TPA: DMT family transporter [Thermoleophilaceae bacterium]|nr:DMT family transporter [Thermoleophilaceae bacterium]
MDIVLALAAALLFGVGTVLQQRAAMQVPDEEAMKAGLLVRLAKEPVWLAGIVADALGFVLQAVALAVGRIVVVQPLLATAVVFALPFGARLDRRRLTRNEILGAAAVVGGVASFVVVSNPTGGVDDPELRVWIVSGAICLAASGALALVAKGRSPGVKASLLGSAAGILFALSAVLTKAVADQFDDGILDIFVHWQLYALVAVGWVGMTLSSAALQTGALAPAAATQMSLDPVVSVALGVFAFDESLHETFVGGAVALAGFAVMIVGLVVLSGSQSSRETNAVVPTKAPMPA